MKLWLVPALAIVLCITGCRKNKVEPAARYDLNPKEIPAQESWGTQIVFTDSGRTKATLETGHLTMYSKTMETRLDSSVKVNFYNKYRRVETVMTSKRGKVDDRTKNLYAYENVVVKNDSGVTVTTDELMWNNEREKIATDKFVTITTKVEKIQGYGFESDQFLRNYVIYRITYVTRVKGGNE